MNVEVCLLRATDSLPVTRFERGHETLEHSRAFNLKGTRNEDLGFEFWVVSPIELRLCLRFSARARNQRELTSAMVEAMAGEEGTIISPDGAAQHRRFATIGTRGTGYAFGRNSTSN